MRGSLRMLLLTGSLGLGCENKPAALDAGSTEPSPNASILPAPLATGRETTPVAAPNAGNITDAGTDAEVLPPTPGREDEALPPDHTDPEELSGLELKGRFRWPDLQSPGRQPETNVDVIERARAASTFDVKLTLAAAGRLNLTLDSRRFVFPEGSELRARSDVYGHALVWPDHERYVILQPGALRTALNERRADVVPLTRLTPPPGTDGKALGFTTERRAFVTPLGRVELEQALVPASGQGGVLLCRLLVELGGVHPDTPACAAELVPVRAEYIWNEGGRLIFEASLVNRVAELDAERLRTPPNSAEHRIGELPAQPSPLLLERQQLKNFRVRPANTPNAKDAPKEGLLVLNGDDLPRYFLIDGVPVLRLLPRGAGVQLELLRGTYSASTRTFLGDEIDELGTVTAPARLVVREVLRSEP